MSANFKLQKNNCCIARFPCDSTAFLFVLATCSIHQDCYLSVLVYLIRDALLYRIISECVCVQVGGRLVWKTAGLTVNTTKSTLYEQFIEGLRPRTGYAVRVSLVYRSLLRSVWPSSIQHTFFTSGRLCDTM